MILNIECHTCKFWCRLKPSSSTGYSDQLGECRLNPPTRWDKDRYRSLWPVTQYDGWCGQYQFDDS